ncbi:3-phosphoshikimate 1-carboxyvinyltransferase [Rubeoparvulum massiliense]|uniref:3-phosphoshikimate 1-carboxyvinyltransferase n=1 Tax=Rubeoparvulum massiliense TaxID=1631346 RepID=UPI00065E0530|nr:3-phosphoshikimate 1-carboxyvinyltransferase [Rubeoparvulum massiliense]
MLTLSPRQALQGRVQVPGDKSISHRAVMMGALGQGVTRVHGFLQSADTLHTMELFRQLGRQLDLNEDGILRIEGKGKYLQEPAQLLDVGNSGTTMRLMLGILAGQPFHAVLAGDSSLNHRPMKRVAEPLRQMGAQIDGRQGGEYPPLAIRGGSLRGIHYRSPVASAQVKSALLLAGLFTDGDVVVEEPQQSRDHTERIFQELGIPLEILPQGVRLPAGDYQWEGAELFVPGDFSSAAFLLAAGLLLPGSHLIVENVGCNPTRTGLLDVALAMGGKIRYEIDQAAEPAAQMEVRFSSLHGVEVGGAIIPRLIDELPILAVMATQAEGWTVVRDAQELRVKESDRIAVMAQELRKMGVTIEELPDGFIIEGPQQLHGAALDSHGDHRIGMALMVAAALADSPSTMAGASALQISYPLFYEIMMKHTKPTV